MCSSGAHYLDWEEMEELERIYKEEQEGVDRKYIWEEYLPSLPYIFFPILPFLRNLNNEPQNYT